ncbi:hypothetical protein L195_g063872, partial [Trifolium pratense]
RGLEKMHLFNWKDIPELNSNGGLSLKGFTYCLV